MACAELLMMALVAALKKSNMTNEPIVMWLGNSSSPPRLIPWSSVNKSPGGPPKSSETGSPEKLGKALRHSGEQAMTSLASRISTPAVSLRSQSAHPHGKKNGMSVKKKKGGGAHAARKKKKGGKKKPKKGLKKQHGAKGHSKQKGRKKAKGSKKPPNGMKKQTTRKLPTKHSTRSTKLPGSSDGSHLRETTRGHQRHHSSPEGGQRSQSKEPTTKPDGSERHKKGTDRDNNSPTGASTKPEEATVSGTRKPERNPTGASDLPGKATKKPRDGKKHSTGRDTHGTGHSHHRRHHGTTKANGLVSSVTKPEHGGRHKNHTPQHGLRKATSHHGKPNKISATNSAENTGRKRGTGQPAHASSQAPSKKSPAVTQSPKAESSKSVGSTSQESPGKRSKPAKPPGSSSAMKPAESAKTSATKNVFSSTTVGGTASGGAKADSKSSGTSGKVTTAASKAMSSDVTSLLTALRRLEEASKGRDKTTENGSAPTKRPEAKAGEEASMSPVPALVTGNVSLSSVLRTIPVKSPEASTKKSRR